MLLLALESATSSCSAVVAAAGGDILAARDVASAPAAADQLVALIDAAVAAAGIGFADLEVIAVNRGPGSFTGVRAGVAAARALALALNRPVVAVTTLEVLAAAVGPQPRGTIVAAVDARRGQVYAQAFDHRLAARGDPSALAPSALDLERLARPRHLVGSGAALVAAAGATARPIVHLDAEVDARAVARRALARLAAGDRPVAGTAVQPLYLRPPDARLPTLPRGARAGAALSV